MGDKASADGRCSLPLENCLLVLSFPSFELYIRVVHAFLFSVLLKDESLNLSGEGEGEGDVSLIHSM